MVEDSGTSLAMPAPGWLAYYKRTQAGPPRPLLVKAAALLGKPGDALDLGCGAGNDTKYLLDQGFRVTAVDSSPLVAEYLAPLAPGRLICVISSFADFNYQTYDLITAQLALPFSPRDGFATMFAQIRAALRPGGIFTGHFFGVGDGWNTPDSGMTFHTRTQAETLLEGLELAEFTETEREVTLAAGTLHQAHLFEIIARRPMHEQ